MSLLTNVNTDRFDTDVLQSAVPVLIDFHATWCGPCKAMVPSLEDIAREYQGAVSIVKVDIDAEPELAKRYDVRTVPTFILVSGGEARERYTGGMTRGKLSAIFERHVAAKPGAAA